MKPTDPKQRDETTSESNLTLQAAIDRTKTFLAWQKRKQTEARTKSVIPKTTNETT